MTEGTPFKQSRATVVVSTSTDALSVVQAAYAEGVHWSLLSDVSTGPESTTRVDLSQYSDVIDIVSDGPYVTVQSGCTWGQLEDKLNAHELTLGPVPVWVYGHSLAETFLQGTLERPSPRYGNLANAILSVHMALPWGERLCVRHHRVGPWGLT